MKQTLIIFLAFALICCQAPIQPQLQLQLSAIDTDSHPGQTAVYLKLYAGPAGQPVQDSPAYLASCSLLADSLAIFADPPLIPAGLASPGQILVLVAEGYQDSCSQACTFSGEVYAGGQLVICQESAPVIGCAYNQRAFASYQLAP